MKSKIGFLVMMFTVSVAHADFFEGHPGIPGDYSVPVSAELEPFAHYPIDRVCWFVSGDAVIVSYTLPMYLTGHNDSRISLKGSAPKEGRFKLRGHNDVAECVRADKKVSCTVTYSRLPIDSVQRDLLVNLNFSDPDVLRGKLAVAASFGEDPVGIISFDDTPEPIPPGDQPPW